MYAGQREGGLAVIEIHILPSSCVVAGGAIGAELPVVFVFCRMTGKAILRRAFIDIVDVTCFTLNGDMSAGQSKGSLAVIETDILPGGGVVTRSAVGAKLSGVNIPGSVAGKTIFGRTLEFSVDVARRAGNFCMVSV